MPKILLSENIAERLIQDFGGSQILPSERELAARYVCNRRTIRSAVSLLAERGILDSHPRSGHYFRSNGAEKLQTVTEQQRKPVVLLLSMADRFYDPAHNCMIGGAVHQAAEQNLALLVHEVAPDFLRSGGTLQDLTEGLEPDGFFIAGTAPLALHELVQKSMKPCVMLGRFYEEYQDGRGARCKQIITDLTRIYSELGEMLSRLGHRKVLWTAPWRGRNDSADALRAGLGPEVELDLFCEWPQTEILTPTFQQRLAAEALRRLDGHTALLAPHGHIFGLELLCGLQKRGIRWPDDISVILTEAETDWYLETFGVSAVHSEIREQGVYCIRELARQIATGKLEYGFGYTPINFIDRNSVGKPPKNQK